jgi:cytidylate kinase
MEAIVLAGSPASGKTVAAVAISKILGVPLVGGTDILKQMAIEKGYKPGGEDWWDKGEGIRFLEERKTNPEFDKETDRRMAKVIKKGNVVTTSATAPWIIEEGFKVWIAASKETRAVRMAKRDHMELTQAERVIAERDEKNRKLYMALYKIDFGHDTKPFHLVVETDNMTEDQVVQMILDNFKKRNKM